MHRTLTRLAVGAVAMAAADSALGDFDSAVSAAQAAANQEQS